MMFPNQATLRGVFAPASPFASNASSSEPVEPRSRNPFPAWSAVDDVKSKASQLGTKASEATQAKAGTLELYSAKYYIACTFGGILACVRDLRKAMNGPSTHKQIGTNTHRRDPS